ncbi:MAG: TSUP family transporter [Verrucomicrobiota bacterium]
MKNAAAKGQNPACLQDSNRYFFDPMSVVEMIFLAASAGAAGAINAVAGGGTLVTFPTLLFFGTPPVIENASRTLALVLGTGGSVVGYRRHLKSIKAWLWRFVPSASWED